METDSGDKGAWSWRLTLGFVLLASGVITTLTSALTFHLWLLISGAVKVALATVLLESEARHG